MQTLTPLVYLSLDGHQPTNREDLPQRPQSPRLRGAADDSGRPQPFEGRTDALREERPEGVDSLTPTIAKK